MTVLRVRIVANGIGIEIDDQRLPGGEPLLLIMGLGMQFAAWPDELAWSPSTWRPGTRSA